MITIDIKDGAARISFATFDELKAADMDNLKKQMAVACRQT
jgi:hypothetical protein